MRPVPAAKCPFHYSVLISTGTTTAPRRPALAVTEELDSLRRIHSLCGLGERGHRLRHSLCCLDEARKALVRTLNLGRLGLGVLDARIRLLPP